MGIAKRPKLATTYNGPRAGERDSVSLEATCRVGDGESFAVAVLDLDAHGCRVRGFGAAATKFDAIALRFGELDPVHAGLRWVKRGSAGLAFANPLSEAELEVIHRSAGYVAPTRVVPLRRPLSDV